MGVEIKIADDLRIEQGNRVGGNRIAEAWMKFLGHRGATCDVAAFQNGDLQPGFCEIGSADESIVAAADDRDIMHDA